MIPTQLVTINGEKFVACNIRHFLSKIQSAFTDYYLTAEGMKLRPSVEEWLKKEYGLDYDQTTHNLLFKNAHDLLLFAIKWS